MSCCSQAPAQVGTKPGAAEEKCARSHFFPQRRDCGPEAAALAMPIADRHTLTCPSPSMMHTFCWSAAAAALVCTASTMCSKQHGSVQYGRPA